MPKGIYPRTEEHKKKIGESRKKYFDEHRTCSRDRPKS